MTCNNHRDMKFGFAAIFVSMVTASVNCETTTYSFTLINACDLANEGNPGCSQLLSGAYKSWISCAAMCRNECIGFKWITDRKCYVHAPCVSTVTPPYCLSGPTGLNVYQMFVRSSPCQNKGVWDRKYDTCKCVDGYVGRRCERYPKSCAELAAYGYFGNSFFTLQINETLGPFTTKCNIQGLTYQNTFIMLNAGWQNNNKTWSDYVAGFYKDEENFWIGLKNFKAINDDGHRTLGLDTTVVWNYGEATSVYGYRFMNFTLRGESAGFSFTYLSSQQMNTSAVYGNCFSPVNGTSFSTWDMDNDLDPTRNTASMFGAGWWFKFYDVGCSPMGVRSKWKMDGLNLDSSYYASTVLYFNN